MTWALILTLWIGHAYTVTLPGYPSEAACQKAAAEWREAAQAQKLKFTTCIEGRPA